MTALMTSLLLLTGAVPGFTGHHRPAARVACCDTCGVETARVAVLIQRLQRCPRWRDRDNAAHALRKVDWKCHPEAALALVTAMMRDCEEEVREEAAESLAKMKPCLPEVHAALALAARCDPDHATRKWARRGLKSVEDRCLASCDVCGPDAAIPTRYVVPSRPDGAIGQPLVIPPTYELPSAPPVYELSPPSELPVVPEVGSPFVIPPSAEREPDDRTAARKIEENREKEQPRPRFILGRLLRPGSNR